MNLKSVSSIDSSTIPPPFPLRLPHPVIMTSQDYVEGISDFTGELMKFKIGEFGDRIKDETLDEKSRSILDLLRDILREMESLEYTHRPTDKIKAVETNLSKLEEASYNLQVRKSERVSSSIDVD